MRYISPISLSFPQSNNWLLDREHPVLPLVSSRLEMATGLKVEARTGLSDRSKGGIYEAEPFQERKCQQLLKHYHLTTTIWKKRQKKRIMLKEF